MADAKKDKLQIRNSTVDFLVFTKDAHEDGIEVRVQDHDVWLTQKAIARLFDVDRSVVTKHLKDALCRPWRHSGRGHYGTSRSHQGTHGADLMEECS